MWCRVLIDACSGSILDGSVITHVCDVWSGTQSLFGIHCAEVRLQLKILVKQFIKYKTATSSILAKQLKTLTTCSSDDLPMKQLNYKVSRCAPGFRHMLAAEFSAELTLFGPEQNAVEWTEKAETRKEKKKSWQWWSMHGYILTHFRR